MVSKRLIYSSGYKHRWHLSYNKVNKLNKLFVLIDSMRGVPQQGPLVDTQIKYEKREVKT